MIGSQQTHMYLHLTIVSCYMHVVTGVKYVQAIVWFFMLAILMHAALFNAIFTSKVHVKLTWPSLLIFYALRLNKKGEMAF